VEEEGVEGEQEGVEGEEEEGPDLGALRATLKVR
jgi:hypothetical protein